MPEKMSKVRSFLSSVRPGVVLEVIIAAVPTLIALWLASHELGRRSPWFDELMSFRDLRWPLWEILLNTHGKHPPGAYVFFKLAWELAGSLVSMRFVSVLFFTATIPFTYLIGRRVHSPMAGVIAAFWTAIHVNFLGQAHEMRHYAILLFGGSAVFYSILVLYDKLEAGRKIKAGFIILMCLAVLLFVNTQLFSMLHLAGIAVIALMYALSAAARGRKDILKIFGTLALVLVVVAGISSYKVVSNAARRAMGKGKSVAASKDNSSFADRNDNAWRKDLGKAKKQENTLKKYQKNVSGFLFMTTFMRPWQWLYIAPLILIAMVGAGFSAHERIPWLFAWSFTPLVIMLFVPMFHFPAGKYLICGTHGTIILASTAPAMALEYIWKSLKQEGNWKKTMLPVAAVFLVGFFSLHQFITQRAAQDYYVYLTGHLEQWSEVFSYINRHSEKGDVAVFAPDDVHGVTELMHVNPDLITMRASEAPGRLNRANQVWLISSHASRGKARMDLMKALKSAKKGRRKAGLRLADRIGQRRMWGDIQVQRFRRR